MVCRGLVNIGSFVLSFAVAFTTVTVFRQVVNQKIDLYESVPAVLDEKVHHAVKIDEPNTTKVKIISKPTFAYCANSKSQPVRKKAVVLVEFLANGKIGEVYFSFSPDNSYDERAKEWAKQIKFKPAVRDGQPITVLERVKFEYYY